MLYRVDLSPRAISDLDWIDPDFGQAAQLEEAILSLETMPERCAVVPALCSQHRSVRQLFFGEGRHVYRVYFEIVGNVVNVIHVRHGARRQLKRL